MKGVALFLLLSTTPACADELIDYDLLFKQNADKVVQGVTPSGEVSRSIDFGNGVTVTCTGEPGAADCLGVDRSDGAAVGCMLAVFVQVLAVARQCLPDHDPKRMAVLEQRTDLIGRFAARNAVPQREWESLKKDLFARFPMDQADCSVAADPEGELLQFFTQLTEPSQEFEGPQSLGPDRLPVMNPCL